MDEELKEIIDFSVIKETVIKKRTTIKYVCEDTGIPQNRLSSIITGWVYPKTDAIAKIAWALKVPLSEVVRIKIDTDPKKAKWFDSHHLPYLPADNAEGKLTYQPLWNFLDMYLDYLYQETGKEKTANDVFDLIEPYRRRNNIKCGACKEIAMKSVEARFGKDYKPATRKRKYEAKGLTPETRHKLRADLPVNIRTIYDICKFLGCPIDWVVSYK